MRKFTMPMSNLFTTWRKVIRWADLINNTGHDVVEKPPFFMAPGGAA